MEDYKVKDCYACTTGERRATKQDREAAKASRQLFHEKDGRRPRCTSLALRFIRKSMSKG